MCVRMGADGQKNRTITVRHQKLPGFRATSSYLKTAKWTSKFKYLISYIFGLDKSRCQTIDLIITPD